MEGQITVSTRALARLAVVVALIVAIGLLAAAVVQEREALAGLLGRSIDSQFDRDSYQAVFLANNQVYFGKLSNHGSDYFVLSDVYYLGSADQASPPPGQQQINQLVKRGNELHKPQDQMIIPAREILFIENLRRDSELVDAIKRFKAGESPAPTARPAATVAPAPAAPASTRPTESAPPASTASASPRPSPTR